MGPHRISLLIKLILLTLTTESLASRCLTPAHVSTTKYPEKRRYYIEIAGNPSTYTPREKYTVSLRTVDQSESEKFTDFILLAENNETNVDLAEDESSAGSFQLLGDALSQFHNRCPNAVMQTNPLPKNEIQVLWVAPRAKSGCVTFKATVVISKDLWYSEDGPLSRIFCENSQDTDGIDMDVLEKCCACHEAKYEVTFEGLWSRNTHPKDFPADNFMTKFSDIIGATHSSDYYFWRYGEVASDGLKELAEHGNTKLLERELKDKSDHIRTIIKARGMSYPNITGRTFAVFRVDDRHHLMSLVSMVHPSPDWIVGVSMLELCQRNCTWVESKVLNLYPWDAGTDSGTTYQSENNPTTPQEPVTRITSKNADTPFYNEHGNEMKPLAKLILSRQRLYEKHTCESSVPDDGLNSDSEDYCAVTEWREWSSCSVTCGKGGRHRQRSYKHKTTDQIKQHEKCGKNLTQRGQCTGAQHTCRSEPPTTEGCELTPWSKLSTCSVTCGNGTQTRSRRYKNHMASKRCAQISNQNLEQNKACSNDPCDPEDMPPPISEECQQRAWSLWSPCSVTCGKGIQTRKKLAISAEYVNRHNRLIRSYDESEEEPNEDDEDENEGGERDPCESVEEAVECESPDMPECHDSPPVSESDDEVADCLLTEWSHWSPCSASCGKGHKYRTRKIIHFARNGGKPCHNKKLKQQKRCKSHCVSAKDQDCILADEWSAWTPCTHNCGPNSVQQRVKHVVQRQSGKGKPCGERIDIRKCSLPVCPDPL